jgi:hypothetical protein
MEKSIAEVLDGYAIAMLKKEKIGNEQTISKCEKYKRGFDELQAKYPQHDWDFILQMFYDVNRIIWKYEAAIRLGVVEHDPMFVHKHSELVREFNSLRVALGNLVSLFLGETEELNIKKDHIAESKNDNSISSPKRV